jgi:shikimate kinase
MMMKGTGTSHGAATIVSAFASGKGAAFGIDLSTTAEVVLSEGEGIDVIIDGFSEESTVLAENCVRAVLGLHAPGQRFHARVTTRSSIPVSRGLKSSSAAANAIVFGTLDALGVQMDEVQAIRLGTRAAIEAGVSVTGAFDDACASWFGGVVLTDNRSEQILARDQLPNSLKVLVHVPDFQIRKASLPLERIAAVRGIVDLAFQQAQSGDYDRALTLNGMCYSAALGLDQEVAMKALQSGALAAGLTGSGPATVMLVVEDKVREFIEAMKGYDLLTVDLYNGRKKE